MKALTAKQIILLIPVCILCLLCFTIILNIGLIKTLYYAGEYNESYEYTTTWYWGQRHNILDDQPEFEPKYKSNCLDNISKVLEDWDTLIEQYESLSIRKQFRFLSIIAVKDDGGYKALYAYLTGNGSSIERDTTLYEIYSYTVS